MADGLESLPGVGALAESVEVADQVAGLDRSGALEGMLHLGSLEDLEGRDGADRGRCRFARSMVPVAEALDDAGIRSEACLDRAGMSQSEGRKEASSLGNQSWLVDLVASHPCMEKQLNS